MGDSDTDIFLNVFNDEGTEIGESKKTTSPTKKGLQTLEKRSKIVSDASKFVPSKKIIVPEKAPKRKREVISTHRSVKRFKPSEEKNGNNKGFGAKKTNTFLGRKSPKGSPKVSLSLVAKGKKPKEEHIKETLFTTSHFSDLSLHPHMVANLQQTLGLDQLTMVQKLSIPSLSTGRDALIRSPTGSGKTIAYAVPVVEALHKSRPKIIRSDGVMAIIVVPTRELALQTYEWFLKLVKPFTWVVPGYLAGGEKRKSEKARLRRGVNILVSTPGRLVDHVCHTRNLQLYNVKYLVLDEADRMLDLGYEKDVSSIVSALDDCQPGNRCQESAKGAEEESWNVNQLPRRQTVLLSATLTAAVKRLAGLTLRDAVNIEASGGSPEEDSFVIPKSIVQWYMIVPPKLRLVVLAAFITWKCKMTEEKKILVFCATQYMVDYLTDLLAYVLGVPDSARNEETEHDDDDEISSEGHLVDVQFFKLHGSMTQTDRTEVFKAFRKKDAGVLLCTDVASRGLDLPRVDWVLQWTAPPSPTDYVHRVGRTARAGNTGAALLFLAPSEEPFLRDLEQKNIRPDEESLDRCLEYLLEAGQSIGMFEPREVRSEDDAAVALHLRFENAVLGRADLHKSGCKAFTSFVRFYSTYPKESKEAFSVKNLHLGHYAKSFAIRDPPSAIGVAAGRSFSKERTSSSRADRSGMRLSFERSRRPSRGGDGSHESRSQMLLISEYASGLKEPKGGRKRKRKGSDP